MVGVQPETQYSPAGVVIKLRNMPGAALSYIILRILQDL